jgi:long-chain acyl-CoA synthetase
MQVAAVLGGKVKYIASGAAPISPEILDFLRIALSCDAVEGKHLMFHHQCGICLSIAGSHAGYGMTENCGSATAGLPGDFTSAGTVGPPHICTEIKLVDVPDMSYTSLDKPNPRGEICTRGPSTFKGYLKGQSLLSSLRASNPCLSSILNTDPINTKAALDEEGWLHTGDVGEFDHLGRLKIIDRIKVSTRFPWSTCAKICIKNIAEYCKIISGKIHCPRAHRKCVFVITPNPSDICSWRCIAILPRRSHRCGPDLSHPGCTYGRRTGPLSGRHFAK